MSFDMPLMEILSFGLGILLGGMRLSSKYASTITSLGDRISTLEGEVKNLQPLKTEFVQIATEHAVTSRRVDELKDCLRETGDILLRHDREFESWKQKVEMFHADD